jgi:hypothetical protein
MNTNKIKQKVIHQTVLLKNDNNLDKNIDFFKKEYIKTIEKFINIELTEQEDKTIIFEMYLDLDPENFILKDYEYTKAELKKTLFKALRENSKLRKEIEKIKTFQ